MMGGAMGVHSQPGHGSTFWFEMPLEEGDLCPLDGRAGIAGRRVLIVDDEQIDRSVLQHLVKSPGPAPGGSSRPWRGSEKVAPRSRTSFPTSARAFAV